MVPPPSRLRTHTTASRQAEAAKSTRLACLRSGTGISGGAGEESARGTRVDGTTSRMVRGLRLHSSCTITSNGFFRVVHTDILPFPREL
jgi:hypothetical protein